MIRINSTFIKQVLFFCFLLPVLGSCDSLNSNKDWPYIFDSVWKSRDGNIELIIEKRETNVTIPGVMAYFTIKIENKSYEGFFSHTNLFKGTNEPLDYGLYDYEGTGKPGEALGEIRLLKKKGDDNITVQFTGPIEISSVQLNRIEQRQDVQEAP